MKLIKLLLIINIIVLVISCKEKGKVDKQNSKYNKTPDISVKKTSIVIIDTLKAYAKDTTSKKDYKMQDSNNNNNNIEIIINGKIYLKKHKNDTKVIRGNSNTHYYNEETDYYYDIITGKTVYDYGEHGVSIPEK